MDHLSKPIYTSVSLIDASVIYGYKLFISQNLKISYNFDRDEPKKEENFEIGPLSVLSRAVNDQEMILINLRNNKKLLGRLKAYDCHYNMLLTDVKELWIERMISPDGTKSPPIPKDRYIAKLFLRGDGIILILKNPFNPGM